MIRPALHADIPAAIECGRRLHARSVYAKHWVDQASCYQTMARAIADKTALLLVAEHDKQLTGLMLLQALPYWWASPAAGARYVTDLVFGAERAGDGMGMLRAGIEWAWTVPRVAECTFGISSGITPERTAELYRLAGMKELGGMWMVER